jgi:Flp pilus assembly pilin Flp
LDDCRKEVHVKREDIERFLRRAWHRFLTDQSGLTTLEYVIAAGIILVVLSAAILAWNNGLATKIGELIRQLLGG